MKEKIENKIIFNYFITGFLTVLFICLEWIIYPIRNTDEYYWGGYTYLSFVCFVLFIIIVYKIIQTISLKKKLSCIEHKQKYLYICDRCTRKILLLVLIKKINKIPSDTKCHLATVRERGGIYFRDKYEKRIKNVKDKILSYSFTYSMNNGLYYDTLQYGISNIIYYQQYFFN